MSFENAGMGEQAKNPKRATTSPETNKAKGLMATRKRLAVAECPELPKEDRELEERGETLEENGKTFSQMLEESQKGVKFQEGEVVEGLVVNTSKDFVTIDIGYKSEGQINAQEFYD